ncbi:MAG: 6-phosphogluconolactonase [Chitinophagaceae bacterium]|nr:6-phosphogluconolactonase [Chitinophagaceae bacterium]
MKILVYPSPMEVIRSAAELFVELAAKAIEERGRCNVSLSGGNSPKQLYELLEAGYCDKIDWSALYFFFGDERYVPFDDPQSNGLMAKKTLFNQLHIADDHIFYIDTSLPAEEAAKGYESGIRAHFQNNEIKFDIILLGLGDNSHTASLFPHDKVLHEKTALVKAVFVAELHQHRITMTAPLINAAHNILFLVYGEGKAKAVHHIIHGEKNIEEYPAQIIEPADGELYWVLDKAAAGLLKH